MFWAIILLAICLYISIAYGAGNDIPLDVNRWTGKSKIKNYEEEEEALLIEKGRRNGR